MEYLNAMIRARFKTSSEDYRPINWPIKHPYWCTGFNDTHQVIVAYADDEEEILRNWPEAIDIDSEECTTYTFTSRFPKPSWFVTEVE